METYKYYKMTKKMKKMKKKKYLPVYYEWMERDWFPFLCHFFAEDQTFYLFIPNESELNQHVLDGYERRIWGISSDASRPGMCSPLRQNIVLLLAAINNEL